jgi:hypothetical protein
MSLEQFHTFLRERMRSSDALLIDQVSVESQEVKARILKVYKAQNEGPARYSSGEISFTGTPGSWGNPTLHPNDKAVAFIGYHAHSKRYLQHAWLAHFLIINQDDQEYALATWNINNTNWWPSEFHAQCIVPDTSKPWRVAIPFPLFENHLITVASEHAP